MFYLRVLTLARAVRAEIRAPIYFTRLSLFGAPTVSTGSEDHTIFIRRIVRANSNVCSVERIRNKALALYVTSFRTVGDCLSCLVSRASFFTNFLLKLYCLVYVYSRKSFGILDSDKLCLSLKFERVYVSPASKVTRRYELSIE